MHAHGGCSFGRRAFFSFNSLPPTILARKRRGRKEFFSSSPLLSYPYDDADADAEGRDDPDLAGRVRPRTMSASSSKPPPPPQHQLHLHVDNTSATAAASTNGSADSPGSESSSHSSRRAKRPTPTGGGAGSGHQACAACKHQRRRCTPDCPLAPYFPADQMCRFHNAHRLFGVSNIQKTLRAVGPEVAPEAMRALIYESEARAADPVGGCVGIIEELRRQIHAAEMYLQYVRQQIAIHRAASASASAPNNTAAMAGQQDSVVAVDALYAAGQQPIPEGGSGLIFHDQQDYNHALKVEEQNHDQQLYHYFCYNNGAAGVEATCEDGGSQVALGEQLGHNCKIGEFNMKPQLLPPATIQHHGPAAAGDVLHPEQEKHDDVDEHMEEQQALAGTPCHLELGFSSFLSNA